MSVSCPVVVDDAGIVGGEPMVRREAKKGPNAGSSFFGCPNYPRCRETVAAA